MSKKKSPKHESKDIPDSSKKSGGFIKFLIIFIIIIAIIGGSLYYIYRYQPGLWNSGTGWINDKMGKSQGLEGIDYSDIEPGEGIPEEYYEGHKAEAGEISRADAEAKMREEFDIEDNDVVMAWPEKIPAGEWIWESSQTLGPIGKLSSDGWLFWVDREYGGMYPHPTYYIVVYGDGYVDVFVGSFTPAVGDDSWVESGSKAELIQGSLDVE